MLYYIKKKPEESERETKDTGNIAFIWTSNGIYHRKWGLAHLKNHNGLIIESTSVSCSTVLTNLGLQLATNHERDQNVAEMLTQLYA